MSRITKYRCWDGFNREWTYSEIMGLAKFFSDYEMRLEGDNHCSLEECTGLKDLWEHDIIQITKENDSDHGFYLPVGSEYIVVWDDNHSGFCLASKYEFEYNRDNKDSQVDYSYYGLASMNLEIPIIHYSKKIGNIHEDQDKL